MALVAIYQQKENARIKNPWSSCVLLLMLGLTPWGCTLPPPPLPQYRARGDEVGISRVEV